MATNILMPALSPTMTEGTLSRWLKKEGENVRAGDVIAEIETDKATMEVEAVDEGVLGKILVQDGTEGVKVNEPIAMLVEQGEAVPAAAAPAPATPRRPAPDASPGSRRRRPEATRRPAPTPQSGNGHDAGGRAHLRLAVGAADGEAGRDRSRGAEGQRPERAHREGGHRGGAAEGRRPPRRASRCRAGTGCAAVGADRRAAHAGAAQLDPEGDRAAADRGEVDHPAFLRLDGRRDRRADQADERAEREVAEGGAGRVSDHHQRPGDQGRGGDAAPRAGGERRVDRRRHGAVRRCRYQRRGGDPGRADHADRAPRGPEGPGDDQPRDEGPGGTRARAGS